MATGYLKIIPRTNCLGRKQEVDSVIAMGDINKMSYDYFAFLNIILL